MNNKLYEILKDLDNLAEETYILFINEGDYKPAVRKLSNSIIWIEKNLNKQEVINYLKEHELDFENSDVLIKALEGVYFGGLVH